MADATERSQSDTFAADVLVRQTDYDLETARKKLAAHDGDIISAIREYHASGAGTGGTELQENRSTNQRIYGEIRSLMDGAAAEHRRMRESAAEKQRAADAFKKQARTLAVIARAPSPLLDPDHTGPSVSLDSIGTEHIPAAFTIRKSPDSTCEERWLFRMEHSSVSFGLLDVAREHGAAGVVVDSGGVAAEDARSLISEITYRWPDAVIVVVAYPNGPPNTITPVGDRHLSALEKGRTLRARDKEGTLSVSRDGDFSKAQAVLKAQEDGGAHAAITDPIFDIGTFMRFVVATRQAGVTMPVMPCIHTISSATAFNELVSKRAIRVPPGVEAAVAQMEASGDKGGLGQYGRSLAFTAAKALLLRGVQHVHFECEDDPSAAAEIVSRLGLTRKSGSADQAPALEERDESSG